MGTLSKSLTEQYGDRRATWTITGSCSDVAVTGSTFSLPLPSITAKYVYTNKNMASISVYMNPILNGTNLHKYQEYSLGDPNLGMSWASNATKTIPRSSSSDAIPAQNTSTYFKASNKTTRTISLVYQCDNAFAYSARVVSGAYQADWDGFLQGVSSFFNIATANITLNAPPIVACGEPTYSTPHYAGLGAYSVTVESASAQYGGDVQSITLKIGNDEQTQSYSSATVTNKTLTVTPSVAGTYTPTITVTDTRGQVATVNLEQITVNAYTAPNVSFDLQRTNGSGIPNAEGEHGLVTASISYTNAIAKLTQPTVVVRDENGDLVASSATWYTSWNAQSGVSNAVNWTNYNPQSPVTLYAVVSATGSSFSPNESYTVSITPTDNQGGVAQTITQTLSTGFFTIDFKAGGKEIAFGAPADDDLTNYPNGLFKCAMDARFVGDITEIENPYLTLDTTAQAGTKDGDLYAAIDALGWTSDVIE